MTPDELVQVTDRVESKLSDLSQNILNKIVQNLLIRFEETGKVVFSPSDEYSIKTLRQAGITQTDILQEIQKAAPGIKKEIKSAFKDAATNIGRVRVNKYVKQKLNIPIAESANETATEAQKIIDGRINEKELTKKQKELLEDVYKRTNNEIQKVYDGVVRSSNSAFVEVCNEAARKVAAGMGPQKAVRDAIKRVAKNGTYIVYPSGHKDTIEVAVLRAVRTGANQANAKLVLELAKETGQDLVLVSSHDDARPSHQEWQGKIYSLSGTSKKYPEFYNATGFGTVEGLCGANCRHTFTIYYPGFSKNPYKRNNKMTNRKKYDRTQEQRRGERTIRKQKRIIDVLETAKRNTLDIELKKELQKEIDIQKAKLGQIKLEYKKYCEKYGLKTQAIRTQMFKQKQENTVAKTDTKMAGYESYKTNLGSNMVSKSEFVKIMSDPIEKKLFIHYSDAIKRGDVSPLADYGTYHKIAMELQHKCVGLVTSNGIKLEKRSLHCIDRVIGSVEQRRSGITVDDIVKTLTSPDAEVRPIRYSKTAASQKFIYKNAEVTINPDTKNLIQVNPHHRERE